MQDTLSKRRKVIFLLLTLVGSLFFVVLFSMSIGATSIPISNILNSFFNYDMNNAEHLIIRESRLPRAILSILCGGALGVSGAIMQGITKNPIASPSTLGIDAGSSLGLCIAIAFFPLSSMSGIYVATFLGALTSTILIFFMGTKSKSGNTPIRLALAGAAISALFTAISQAIALTNGVSQSIFGWNNSGLQAAQMSYVYFGLPCLIGGLILSILISPKLTILNLGDEIAISLGEKVNKIKLFACFIVLILTGGVITLAGSIGYVGLIIPHMVRHVVGSDYKWIVPYSIVGGALVTLIADILARSINPPFEVPINAITSVIGVPFFLYLLLRKGGDKL